MGLRKESSGGTWVSLSKGIFSIKRGDGLREEFAAIDGHLVNIEFSDKTLPESLGSKKIRQMTLTFQDGHETFRLGIDSSSGYARQTKAKLANIDDFGQIIELSPTYKPETKAAGMFVNANGSPVKQLWTKDNPLPGMPPPKVTKHKGQDLYDYSEQEKFIENYIIENVVPKLGIKEDEDSGTPPWEDEDSEKKPDAEADEDEGSDIPF